MAVIGLDAGIALVAFLVRLLPVLHGGGLGFFGRYDDGVYFTAATSLTFGHVPYRDFVLLHPPGITLALAPFALLARVTSDSVGMEVARLAFMAVGALNAVLVARVARRWSVSAGVVAGLIYACWYAAVYTEQTTLLEPLGTTAVLVALLLLLRADEPSTRTAAVVGLVLGAACTFKIWYAATLLVVLGWLALRRRVRAALAAGAGAAATIAAVCLPFFVMAPSRMWDMVVRDQVTRPAGTSPRLGRIPSILGVRGILGGHHAAIVLVTAVLALLLAASCLVALTDAAGRLLLLVLGADLLVLLAGPAYFGHYATLTASPAAIVLGRGLARGSLLLPSRPRVVAAGVGAVALAAYAAGVVAHPAGRRVDGALLARAAPRGCVTSDDPQILVAMNRLTPDLRAGCTVAVDITGITYDTLHRVGRNGRPVPRHRNAAWQRYIYDYLSGADAFVVGRTSGTGLSAQTARRLASHPLLARSGRVALRAGRGSLKPHG